jgi:ABC-type glycerol-3-phosphate transport system permease component
MADRAVSMAQTARAEVQPRRGFPWKMALIYLVLIVGVLLAVAPFLWMVSSSLMTLAEIAAGQLLPSTPQWGNYTQAWEQARFGQFMWNSARITVITITGQLLFCIPAAYAFARMRFFGKTLLFTVVLSTLMIPEVARFIPNYLTVIWLSRLSQNLLGESFGWLNNWPALTVPFMASAFTIFLLRQFFMQIPDDLWDAARIDGAGHLRYMVWIVVPLSRAAVVTVITLSFIASWNALLWPLLVTQTDDWRPVAAGLTKFVGSDAPGSLHLQMAASVIMTLPIIVIYFFAQRQFTEGITSTGLKG